MIALGEIEKRCIKYINAHLQEPLESESFEFRTWKSYVDIRDIDVYYQVAQGLKQRELKRGYGEGLFYLIRVPQYEGDEFGDIWNVNLVGDQDREFLEKYGILYKVTPLRLGF